MWPRLSHGVECLHQHCWVSTDFEETRTLTSFQLSRKIITCFNCINCHKKNAIADKSTSTKKKYLKSLKISYCGWFYQRYEWRKSTFYALKSVLIVDRQIKIGQHFRSANHAMCWAKINYRDRTLDYTEIIARPTI